MDIGERCKKKAINTKRRHSKRNIADTNLREGHDRCKGYSRKQ